MDYKVLHGPVCQLPQLHVCVFISYLSPPCCFLKIIMFTPNSRSLLMFPVLFTPHSVNSSQTNRATHTGNSQSSSVMSSPSCPISHQTLCLFFPHINNVQTCLILIFTLIPGFTVISPFWSLWSLPINSPHCGPSGLFSMQIWSNHSLLTCSSMTFQN